MMTKIRRLGNSRGIIIPELMPKRAGLGDEPDIALERGAIILRDANRDPRQAVGKGRSTRDFGLTLPAAPNILVFLATANEMCSIRTPGDHLAAVVVERSTCENSA